MPISYDEAQRVVAAAHERAQQLGIRVTVVVVDAAAIRPPVRSQMYRTSRRVDHTI